MSQVVSHTNPTRSQVRTHRLVAVAALLALIATAVVVLVLAIDTGSADPSPVAKTGPDEAAIAASIAGSPQPAARTDGGPEESGVAAAISGH